MYRLSLLLCSLLLASPAFAVSRTWNAGTGNWSTSGNWTPGATPTAADDLTINNAGTAQVTGTANSRNVTLGATGGTSGNVTVDGAGATLTNAGAVSVGASGTGSVTVTNSGTVNTRTITAGTNSGGIGTVTIGTNGRINASNTAVIGDAGQGTLAITGGGVLTSVGGVLADDVGSTSTVTIDGVGSAWNAGVGTLFIGNAGTATVDITNGGSLSGGNTSIGRLVGGGTSTVTVDGTGSSLTTGTLTVGLGSDGELFVTDGATLNSSGGTIGSGTGVGFMEVDNSIWNGTSTNGAASIGVGAGNTGTLNILNGSTVSTSNRLTVGGTNTSGQGTMLIDNSSFTIEPHTVGIQPNTAEIGRDGGMGTLTIRNGSTVQFNDAQLQLGTRNLASDGTLIVEGAGTTVSTTEGFTVGQNGAGHFQLLDGAVMHTGNLISAGNASALSTSDLLIDDATLNITGNGITAAGRLAQGGTASMVLQNGGVLNLNGGDLEVARNAGSVGTLTIAGTGGTLSGNALIGGAGNATVNFNHTNAGQVFAPRLRGNLTVNQLNTGTTILTGDGDYTGTTTVSGGTLRAGVTDAFSQNSAYVMSGGLLDLNGLDNEIGSLAGTSNVTLGAGTLTTGSLGGTTYSGVISGTGGLTKVGNGIFRVNAAQTYTGTTTVADGILRAGLANIITGSSLGVDSLAAFDTGGFSQSVTGLRNDGLVNLFGGGTSTQLTVNGNLSGSGLFNMNTNLAGGVGDHIDITGTSSGAHKLAILNTGGAPATLFTTLELVQTTDSSTGGATFSALGDGVDVGVYSYTVQQGNGSGAMPDVDAWYLALSPESRSEVARAMIGTAAGMSNSWFTQMDNLHRRMGKQRLIDPAAHRQEAWVRGYMRDLDVDASVTGRAFDERINGVDAGVDYVLAHGGGNTWIGGAFGGYGWADRDFNDYGSSGNTKTPYGGLYATWFNASKYYLDLTAKLQYFKNEFDASDASGNTHQGGYEQWGYGGSAEFGKRYDLTSDGWILQPQAQVQYVRLTGEDYITALGSDISVEADNIYQFRAGLELGKTIHRSEGVLYPYARASVIEQASQGGEIRADTLRFDEDFDGTVLEYGVGAIYQFDMAHQAYFTVTGAQGDRYDQRWGINGGLRYEF